jgi:hypothetical protein
LRISARLATALFWHLSVERSCGGEHSRLYKRAHLLLCHRLHSQRVPCDQGLGPSGVTAEGEIGSPMYGGLYGGDAWVDMDKISAIKGGSTGGNLPGAREGGQLLIDVLRRHDSSKVLCVVSWCSKDNRPLTFEIMRKARALCGLAWGACGRIAERL